MEPVVKRSRGRPVKSEVRQNIIEILAFLQSGHGYELLKHYNNIFPDVTMRSIYYNLKKGVAIGEFKILKIVKEKGDFSWGSEAEKTYYSNGPNAVPRGDARVKEYVDKIRKNSI